MKIFFNNEISFRKVITQKIYCENSWIFLIAYIRTPEVQAQQWWIQGGGKFPFPELEKKNFNGILCQNFGCMREKIIEKRSPDLKFSNLPSQNYALNPPLESKYANP